MTNSINTNPFIQKYLQNSGINNYSLKTKNYNEKQNEKDEIPKIETDEPITKSLDKDNNLEFSIFLE